MYYIHDTNPNCDGLTILNDHVRLYTLQNWQLHSNPEMIPINDHFGCEQNTGLTHERANYTDQNYKYNIFVFAPIFHELNSNI